MQRTDVAVTPSVHDRKWWLSLLLCAAGVGVFAWLRLAVFHDQVFPLSIGLPLLLCYLNRSKNVLYGMALFLTVVTLAKVLIVLPAGTIAGLQKWAWLGTEMRNIWVVAFALHALLAVRERLVGEGRNLETVNAALEQNNRELTAREAEISRQSEELQSQTEELEQQ